MGAMVVIAALCCKIKRVSWLQEAEVVVMAIQDGLDRLEVQVVLVGVEGLCNQIIRCLIHQIQCHPTLSMEYLACPQSLRPITFSGIKEAKEMGVLVVDQAVVGVLVGTEQIWQRILIVIMQEMEVLVYTYLF